MGGEVRRVGKESRVYLFELCQRRAILPLTYVSIDSRISPKMALEAGGGMGGGMGYDLGGCEFGGSSGG
jgi:hypothetical protein